MRRVLLTIITALTGVSVGAGAVPSKAPEPVRAQAREILRATVAMQTSEGHGQVPAMAQYLAGKFRAAGFAAEDVEILPHGETASLVVRYRGRDRHAKPILVLAHLDVVEARAEDWDRDPFVLIEENGYFYGRGTADVKNEVAIISATFLRLKAEGFQPSRDLVIAFSGDEETVMESTRGLAKHLAGAEFALNGDGGQGVLNDQTGAPEAYHLQGAEKYYASFKLTARNPGGHSAQPRPDNAIYMTNKPSLIERIAELTRESHIEGIADLRDESDRHGLRIVIELSKTAEPEKVLQDLYKSTPMRTTFGIILLALVDGEPRMLSLKQALRVYLDHRLEVIRRRSEHDLEKTRQRPTSWKACASPSATWTPSSRLSANRPTPRPPGRA